jgi:predicted AAA+ superfamily ATPase
VLIPRHVRGRIEEALGDTRVVMVVGARQVGKSTLVEELARQRGAVVRTLDDQATRESARADPRGFVAGLGDGLVVIDEVQRAAEILLAIKMDVDRNPRPGRFLLTGSANLLTLPMVADALTGRIETLTLSPLSQAEIERSSGNVVDALFAGTPPAVAAARVGRAAWVHRAAVGGYPEARTRAPRRRAAWFESYLTTTLTRDLADIGDIRKAQEVPRLLSLLASQAANIAKWGALGARAGLDARTARAYAHLLQTMFLVQILPGWRPGLAAREVQAPKVYISDTGLLAHLLGADESRIASDDQVTGKLFENFVAMEVVRHLPWAAASASAFHYRDSDRRRGGEIDLVLEDRAGAIVAVEAKASATVRPSDFLALSRLRDQRRGDLRAGVVVYTGEQTVPFGDRLWALPVSALWS